MIRNSSRVLVSPPQADSLPAPDVKLVPAEAGIEGLLMAGLDASFIKLGPKGRKSA
ncbi:MAG: hypothetical protein KAJ46_08620 [Sedimentisphaerales bacterium]|nr:hypothetical protein [Sedimentisphaerales bacterium]